MSNRIPVCCVGTGIDLVMEAARAMAATPELTIHKTASVGWSETIIPYEISLPKVDLSAMVQWTDNVGQAGRPKRNKSKLKQQRKSRRRNRC